MNLDNKKTAPFITGAVIDFLLFIAERENPLIVGRDYPRDKLVEAFNTWAKLRDIDISTVDVETWRNACRQGFFKKEE